MQGQDGVGEIGDKGVCMMRSRCAAIVHGLSDLGYMIED